MEDYYDDSWSVFCGTFIARLESKIKHFVTFYLPVPHNLHRIKIQMYDEFHQIDCIIQLCSTHIGCCDFEWYAD